MVVTSGFTSKELSVLIGCTTRTVRNMIDRGRFPNARKLDPDSENSTWIIPFTDYHEFLQNAEVKVRKTTRVVKRLAGELDELFEKEGGIGQK